MNSIFTDYKEMVGKRPREAYWSEIQDAIVEVNDIAIEASNPAKVVINPISGNAVLLDYPIGLTVFEVYEEVSSGYPSLNGLVETVHISEFRNTQYFFDYPEEDVAGETYYRQWRPSLGTWTNFTRVLTGEDLLEHTVDDTAHIGPIDRIRLDGYRHVQTVAERLWVIDHNLNKFPSVAVVDTAGTLLLTDVRYVSSNQIQIAFSEPTRGVANLG